MKGNFKFCNFVGGATTFKKSGQLITEYYIYPSQVLEVVWYCHSNGNMMKVNRFQIHTLLYFPLFYGWSYRLSNTRGYTSKYTYNVFFLAYFVEDGESRPPRALWSPAQWARMRRKYPQIRGRKWLQLNNWNWLQFNQRKTGIFWNKTSTSNSVIFILLLTLYWILCIGRLDWHVIGC